ncbi:hypothetical protein O2V63_10700 [Modestobacter sp. VKM Ac-2977]|uniref:hypothetical protein n=1 Tax=Modestobacter sp. VKM Ac-2977 TaxID=3004131 RepID=UPI0022AB4ADA|nr:hypothetical protein [Modestobacter sp. VKM Ac-2977]MCZ2820797.1 hypothetical protein [Modestobacter sp. VKM Ac-2977]
MTVPPTGDVSSLELFLGDAEFTVDSGGPLLVRGHGVPLGERVRFHEKDVAGGKDVRVWHVSQQDDGFMAEPLAAF